MFSIYFNMFLNFSYLLLCFFFLIYVIWFCCAAFWSNLSGFKHALWINWLWHWHMAKLHHCFLCVHTVIFINLQHCACFKLQSTASCFCTGTIGWMVFIKKMQDHSNILCELIHKSVTKLFLNNFMSINCNKTHSKLFQQNSAKWAPSPSLDSLGMVKNNVYLSNH